MEMGWLLRIPQDYSKQRGTVQHQSGKHLLMLLWSLGDDNSSGLAALTVSQVPSLRASHRVIVMPLPRLICHHRA
jgi:hypothetical protein